MYNIKKETRRILTLALTAIMIFAMMPFMPGAAQQANAEGTKSYSPKVVRVIENWDTVPSENVTVNLLADGRKVASVELDGEIDAMKTDSSTGISCGETAKWVAVFKDLPAFDKTGEHEIKYTVSEDPVNGFSSEITGPKQTASTTETYNITHTIDSSATIQPTVKVVWNDEDLEKQEIPLNLVHVGDAPEFKDIIDGTITLDGSADSDAEYEEWTGRFKSVPKYDSDGYTIKYELRVATTNDSWTAEVTGSASKGFVVTINNNKKTVAATIAAEVHMNLTSPVYDGQFAFTLKPADPTKETPMPENAVTENNAYGEVEFGPIRYTEAGEYNYTITQNIPADATAENDYTANGITYDTSEWTVTVTVAVDGNGNLTIKNISCFSKDRPPDMGSLNSALFNNTGGTGNPNLTIDATKVWVPFAPDNATAYVKISKEYKSFSYKYNEEYTVDLNSD
ncbi:MAG: Spy0128 family protein, partial [Anaerovoracaceae bacterium]